MPDLVLTRRRFVQHAAAGGAAVAMARVIAGPDIDPADEQSLVVYNTHTREAASVVFRRGKNYDESALASLQKVLRDHRNDETHAMDVRLYEQLVDLARAAKVEASYEIISAYRSPESNSKMATPGSGVAKKSLHMEGRAIDVRLRNCSCEDLRDLALAAAKGGVGYYKRSNFVHLDTGSFRTWVG